MVVENATLATLNVSQINDIVTHRYPYIEVSIPYNGQNVTVQLFKDDILAQGFHVDTPKRMNVEYQPGVYYKGIVKNNPESVAALSFFDGELTGIISNDEFSSLVIGRVQSPGNTSEFIIYSDAKMKVLNQFSCHVKEDAVTEHDHGDDQGVARAPMTVRCVTMY